MENHTKPLEVQERHWHDENGREHLIPALDIRFASDAVEFPLYFSAYKSSNVNLEAWQKMSGDLGDALRWLLRLPYHRFWSQLRFERQLLGRDSGFLPSLDSFLRSAPRITEPEVQENILKGSSETRKLYEALYERFFRILIRLSSYKVERSPSTPNDYMSEEYHASLLSGPDGLLPVPRLMDICAMYFPSNPLVGKMVGSILNKGPYAEETAETLALANTLLTRCSAALGVAAADLATGEKAVSKGVVVQTVAYAVDTLHSLTSFARAAPAHAIPIAYNSGTVLKIVAFCEDVQRECTKALPALSANGLAVWNNITSLKGRLLWLEESTVAWTRLALQHLVFTPLADRKIKDPRQRAEALSRWVEVSESVAACPHLAVAYSVKHPIQDDIANLEKEAGWKSDLAKRAEGVKKLVEKRQLEAGFQAKVELEALAQACSVESLEAEQATVLSDMAEMFGDLGQPFLLLAGHQYGWNHEALPPPPPEPVPEDPGTRPGEHPDGLQRIRTGKKHGAADWSHADRSEVKKLGGFFAKHTLETQSDWLEPTAGNGDDYDDEYDDTYDSVDRGVQDATPEDLRRARPGQAAAILPYEMGGEEEEDDEEELDRLSGVPLNRNREFAPTRPTSSVSGPARGRGRGGAPRGGGERGGGAPRGSYTGGAGRQRKEQANAHNRANRARAKMGKGMF